MTKPSDAKPKASVKQTFYEVEVKTADDLSSGTDSDVSLSITGADGTVSDLALKSSQYSKNPFETGKLDRFVITANAVGKV